MADLPVSTQRYLAERTPEGERNAALFAAACQFRDAIVALGEAERALIPCAVRDGLSEAEARKAIRSAFKGTRREPIRHRFMDRGGQAPTPAPPQRNGDVPARASSKPARRFRAPAEGEPLPDALNGPQASLRLLELGFGPGEVVSIAPGVLGPDGRDHPASAGATRTREEWIAAISAESDASLWPRPAGAGVFIRANPVKAGGKADADVTAFRHVLLEWDDIPLDRQWAIIRDSRIPCTAVVHSGGRSLHAWVRVDARSEEEYRERVAILYEHFADCPPCPNNKNPSRFSRLPGAVRGERQQALLASRIGATSFGEWQAEANSRLPRIDDARELMTRYAEDDGPPELVAGLLHQGSKMVIGGGSKSYKTWALVDLAISVAAGLPWWGLQTTQARVLYLNFEIQPFFLARDRLQSVLTAKLAPLHPGTLDVWNLRGYAASFDILIPEIIARVRDRSYGLIIIDPIYKGLGGRDENRAGDVAELLNEIERLATQTGAAVVFGAHFSKGNQSGKQSVDRIGGSGVFARDPDSILTLTPHEEPFCYTVEATLRNFPHLNPFVIRWSCPLFQPVSLDAGKLKKVGRPEALPATEVLECLAVEGMTPKAWQAAVQEVHELSRASFYRILEKLIGTGQVRKSEGGLYIRKNQ